MIATRQGVKYPLDGEGYTYKWAVFPLAAFSPVPGFSFVDVVKDQAILEAERIDAIEYPNSNGPGRSFAHNPSVRIGRTRVRVVQTCGLDI